MFQEATIVKQGNNYHAQHGTDNGLHVQFYIESIHDEEASERENRPIYVDREFVKIIIPGDKNTQVCRPIDLKGTAQMPPDNVRWPAQYQAFKNQQEQVFEGTPLEQWPPLSKSQVLMFKAANVHTVEQLVSVSDNNLVNLGMGARELQNKAKAFLESAKDGALVMQLQKMIDDQNVQIQALKNQMAGLGDIEDKKPRGRPAKKDE